MKSLDLRRTNKAGFEVQSQMKSFPREPPDAGRFVAAGAFEGELASTPDRASTGDRAAVFEKGGTTNRLNMGTSISQYEVRLVIGRRATIGRIPGVDAKSTGQTYCPPDAERIQRQGGALANFYEGDWSSHHGGVAT